MLTEHESLYGVRKLLTLYYDYRTSKNQTYLDDLIKERDDTIDKLKAATKYDSTQQLIDKYSSKPSTPQKEPTDGPKKRAASGQHGQGPQVSCLLPAHSSSRQFDWKKMPTIIPASSPSYCTVLIKATATAKSVCATTADSKHQPWTSSATARTFAP